MEYEWDESKRRSNLAKHRVDFTAITHFEWDTAVIESDERHDEPRWVAKGFIGTVLHTVVFTEREDTLRIISLRKATRKEARGYVEYQT